MGIAPAALAALCGDKTLGFTHISHYGAAFRLFNKSTAGNADFKVGRLLAVTARAASVFAVLRFIFSFIAEVGESCEIIVNDENYVAALAAVAAVGTAGGNVLFPVESTDIYIPQFFKRVISDLIIYGTMSIIPETVIIARVIGKNTHTHIIKPRVSFSFFISFKPKNTEPVKLADGTIAGIRE